MSDAVDEYKKILEAEVELNKLKKETAAKEARLKAKRVDADIAKMELDERDQTLIKNSDLSKLSSEEIGQLIKDNDDYFAACGDGMEFINSEFTEIVPFFRKNLITVFGQTGEGKSTAVSNIITSVLKQKKRILVITNEEKREDVYNRVICHMRGWHYVAHDKFTEEQKTFLNQGLRHLGDSGKLMVIDDAFRGGAGATTTYEGIRDIFENLIANNTQYDCVVIDYYQKIDTSKDDPRLREFEVQSRLTTLLDNYKNIYAAPIVIMAQIRPAEKDNSPVEFRIKGSKTILVKSTCVLEMVKIAAELKTKWILHKSRFTEYLGGHFYTIYDNGKFVPNTAENQQKVAALVRHKQFASYDKQNGIKSVDKENKK